MSAPAAVMSVRTAAAGVVLACALTVTLLPFAGPPLVGHAYSPSLQSVQLQSKYTPGGGITELYAQTNPPTSVMVKLLAEYNSWAADPSSEPMPEHRDWYIDREALSERGDFTVKAVRLQTSISCRPHSAQQLTDDNMWWNAFLTNMTRTNNNSTQSGEKNSSAEVWVRPQPQLTIWADDFEFVSERRTKATLVFAALNGTIEGGSVTPLKLGDLTSASSIACDIEVEAVDDILSVGADLPAESDRTNLPTLSSADTLTVNPATPPQTRLNELLLWFTVAPLLASTSVDGTQPMFTNSSTTGLPIAHTITAPAQPHPNANTWTIPGLEHFIRLSIGALAQATTTSSTPSPPIIASPPAAVITLTTTPPLKTLSPPRTLLLLLPPLLTLTLTLFLALYTCRLHARHAIPVLRQADLGELLKSAQTRWMREVAGTDAARLYLPCEMGAVAVGYGVDGGVGGFVAGRGGRQGGLSGKFGEGGVGGGVGGGGGGVGVGGKGKGKGKGRGSREGVQVV